MFQRSTSRNEKEILIYAVKYRIFNKISSILKDEFYYKCLGPPFYILNPLIDIGLAIPNLTVLFRAL